VSDSPQLYQVLDIIHNQQTGRSNVVFGRMNESTVEKTLKKPGHATRESDLMTLIGGDSPFADMGVDGRVHYQTRHTS
ncbi:MAG TPA: hypothetical protein PLZ51_29525, partial [Aggregatilineales bacterium]|nr:hypothetical protein [Aggregatilineales bacterium]